MKWKLELLIGGVVCIAVILMAIRVNTWRHEAARVPGLEQDIKTMTETFDLERKERASETLRHDAVVKGLNDELSTLRADRARRPSRPIRLCDEPSAPAAGMPATVAPARTGDEPTTAGAGALHESTGRDIGPAVYALMDEANEQLASFRALRQWAATLPKCEPVTQ